MLPPPLLPPPFIGGGGTGAVILGFGGALGTGALVAATGGAAGVALCVGVALALRLPVGDGEEEGVADCVGVAAGLLAAGLAGLAASSWQPAVVRATAPSRPEMSRVRTAGLDMRMRRLSRTIVALVMIW
ncbi:hypothetical protein GCM10010326_36070 [Streptomyces xanthochromogenes]|uniref:Uncharacterized protein n=1 Tax=Streptomyces xanthochromogenes TaxID=67384 RepID=A0ABQ3A843_9ACTN|nr:hypothetical protein GCM10010326_36070 [Streptomyces xanthochromogenes]